MTVDEYFEFPETNRPMELVYGYVREPAMPFGDHRRSYRVDASDNHVRQQTSGGYSRRSMWC